MRHSEKPLKIDSVAWPIPPREVSAWPEPALDRSQRSAPAASDRVRRPQRAGRRAARARIDRRAPSTTCSPSPRTPPGGRVHRAAERLGARRGTHPLLARPDGAATPSRPFQERMAFFWHGHFCSELGKVGSAMLMREQIDLWRRDGLGNIRSLATTMSTQVAMIRYLDNNQNKKTLAEPELRPRADGAVPARCRQLHRGRRRGVDCCVDRAHRSVGRRSRPLSLARRLARRSPKTYLGRTINTDVDPTERWPRPRARDDRRGARQRHRAARPPTTSPTAVDRPGTSPPSSSRRSSGTGSPPTVRHPPPSSTRCARRWCRTTSPSVPWVTSDAHPSRLLHRLGEERSGPHAGRVRRRPPARDRDELGVGNRRPG